MSNVCFAFGPKDTFLFNSPSKWLYSTQLPESVLQLFRKDPPIRDVFELALGPNDSYYIGYLDKDGSTYCKNNGLPAGLTAWLSVNARGFVTNDIRTTSIALGPNGSYFAQDKNKMAWSNNLPDDLLKAIKGRVNTDPRIVALGVDGSYVLVNKNGSGSWNLNGRYPDLQKKLTDLPNFSQVHNFQYLSLSPFGDTHPKTPSYSIVMKDGSALAEIPDDQIQNFETIANSIPNMQTQAVSRGAARPAQRHSSSGLSKGLFKTLTHIAGAVINGQLGNGGGGGGGGWSDNNSGGGGGFDTSGFTAGLQQQTWSSTQDAAGDSIQ